MPSKKILATAVGRTTNPVRRGEHNATAVRFSATHPDPVIARVQEDIRAQADKTLKDTPFKNGTVLELDFSTGLEQTVPHKLDGPIQGFIVCDLIGTAGALSIFREDETSSANVDFARADTHIKFRATLPCKAKVWVWR